MPIPWRAAAVLSLAGGLLLPGGLQPVGAASTPAPALVPTLTIKAATVLKPIDGNLLVVFDGGKFAAARLSGEVTGAAAGQVVRLLAQPFPFQRAPVEAASITLTQAAAPYSFTVRPDVATRYQVQVFASPAAAEPLASSFLHTIYVTPGGRLGLKRGCGSGRVCRPQYRFFVYLPAALIKNYVSRRWSVYVGVKRAAKHVPKLPSWLRHKLRATVSPPRRVSDHEYERTVGFTFWAGQDAARWAVLACVRDSEPHDGIGLPGRHQCGARWIRRTIPYLG